MTMEVMGCLQGTGNGIEWGNMANTQPPAIENNSLRHRVGDGFGDAKDALAS